MTYEVNSAINAIRQLNMMGNIISHPRFRAVAFANHNSDLLGVMLLAVIAYRQIEIKINEMYYEKKPSPWTSAGCYDLKNVIMED